MIVDVLGIYCRPYKIYVVLKNGGAMTVDELTRKLTNVACVLHVLHIAGESSANEHIVYDMAVVCKAMSGYLQDLVSDIQDHGLSDISCPGT